MALLRASRPSKSSDPERVLSKVTQAIAKRLLDILVASTALLLLAPVMLLIAIAIPVESRGPVLYSQQRVGLNRRRRAPLSMNGHERRRTSSCPYGRPFRMYKFRSMVPGAEEGTGAVWAIRQDPRVTRVGRFIRRTHLDELPQLWNVLRGDMSVVGPRPERPEIVDRLVLLIPGYERRFLALPGITGLAQVEYCYDHNVQTAARKLQFDLYYLRNSGLFFDVRIMAATMFVMARGNGGGGHAPEIDPLLVAQPSGRSNGHVNGHVNGISHANGHSNAHANGHVNGHGNGNGHVNGSSPEIPSAVPAPAPVASRLHHASEERAPTT
jgi:lipopolysaccharide/colanic/teichoic acid biosynthesis glycosyltransferase